MMKASGLHVIVLAGLLIFMTGCSSSVRLGEDMEEYEDEVTQLRKQLIENPERAEPLQKLGIIYLRTRRYAEGYDHLKKAYARDTDSPKTMFYLGMASEMVGKEQSALRLYGNYAEVNRLSPYRRRMEGRYRWLVQKLARDRMQERLATEQEREGDVSPRIVAVFPLAYQGENEQYAPLSRGLSEMLTVDLASVGRLQLVERARLQALLDELELSQSEYVDPASAPRIGRLLGAGRLVGGSYNVLAGDELRLDAALTKLEGGTQFPDLESRSGSLERLFQLEKELVFRLIEELDVELTPEERRQIEKVPTQNLQAFLAFSQGLEEEAQGNFGAAMQSFERAGQLDPNFQAAKERADAAAGLQETGGAAEGTLENVLGAESFQTSSINLMDQRLRILNENTGSLYLPGEEARQPAAEAVGRDTPLPDPPDPPNRGN